MHRSRLSTFVIDCKDANLETATAFWSAALGRPAKPQQAGDDRYRDLECAPSEPLVMIQTVPHESRIHLDIESDDIDAEVARLEKLGAKKIEKVRTWTVMQAPTGQRFCVVRPQRGEIVVNANTWPSNNTPLFAATLRHEKLKAWAGRYKGTMKTFLDPNGPPDESMQEELRIEPIADGRWLRFEHRGFCMSKVHAGEMLLGCHTDLAQYELAWADSFHTNTSIIWSTGKTDGDVVVVTGTYPAGEETWRWRTELEHDGESLYWRAFNIAPAGTEDRALEGVFTRV